MKILKEELNNYNRIIAYSDNCETYIYINGEYIDNMGNGIDAVVKFFQKGSECENKELLTTDIYSGDNVFDNLTEEQFDKIYDILSQVDHLTKEQELAIFNKDFEKLCK
jgi:hypothetical protein